jgi:hypothetical protein
VEIRDSCGKKYVKGGRKKIEIGSPLAVIGLRNRQNGSVESSFLESFYARPRKIDFKNAPRTTLGILKGKYLGR